MRSTIHGPAWLTASAGPEGSVLVYAALVILVLVVGFAAAGSVRCRVKQSGGLYEPKASEPKLHLQQAFVIVRRRVAAARCVPGCKLPALGA